MRRFRDRERFLGLCGECPNFGKRWGCPPFDHDTTELLMAFTTADIYATLIYPDRTGLPASEAAAIMRPVREELERRLIEEERALGGRAFTFVGECLYCPPGTCARITGSPCRHPELVRPSLEAYGFDIALTLRELFGIELKWCAGGKLPEYLTLVTARFH